MDALAAAEAYSLLKDALESQFEVSISDGKGKSQGKLLLKKRQSHGNSKSNNTAIALEMGRRRAKAGESLVDPKAARASLEPLRKAFDLLATGQAIRELGKAGLRGGAEVSAEDMKERAWNMLVAYDRGYNPETGAPYGDVATDGGHKLPHSVYPELSTDPANIMPENAYENRTKGAADDPELVADRLLNRQLKNIRETHVMVPYSESAKREMAEGPEIMRMNRKEYLKAKRSGRL